MDGELSLLKKEVKQEREMRKEAETSHEAQLEDMLACAEVIRRAREAVADASSTVEAAKANRARRKKMLGDKQPAPDSTTSEALAQAQRN